jgi:hypothetical protein
MSMAPRTRYACVAVFAVVLAGVVLLHRWPFHGTADELDAIRQRAAALEHELDAARGVDDAAGYVPRVAGSIEDPSAPAVDLLNQLPDAR